MSLPQWRRRTRRFRPCRWTRWRLSPSREGPNQISRENGKRRVVVTANVRGRDIASVVDDARGNAMRGGEAARRLLDDMGWAVRESGRGASALMIVVPACFVMIFLLLLSALGSARDALLVFSAVPLALTGGVLALWLRGMPFSVSAAVGFIALSGVAVLNGLVMLSHIRLLRGNGMPLVRQSRRRTDAFAAGRHDGSGGFAWFRADGVCHRHRRGSAKANGDSCHRRADQRHAADACGATGLVHALW